MTTALAIVAGGAGAAVRYLVGVAAQRRWPERPVGTGIVNVLGAGALGMLIGALPGFTTVMAMAVLLPLSFFLDPLVGIPFLLGVYKGGIFGGSIPDQLRVGPLEETVLECIRPHRGHREPGEEVEVPVALGVPEHGALAADEGDEAVDGGGFAVGTPVAADPRDAVVFTGDPEDVGPLGGRRKR